MPAPLVLAYGSFQSYMVAHGYLKNATKSLQGSAFSQAQAKIGQALQQTVQQSQIGQTAQTISTGGTVAQQTSKGCLITEVFL